MFTLHPSWSSFLPSFPTHIVFRFTGNYSLPGEWYEHETALLACLHSRYFGKCCHCWVKIRAVCAEKNKHSWQWKYLFWLSSWWRLKAVRCLMPRHTSNRTPKFDKNVMKYEKRGKLTASSAFTKHEQKTHNIVGSVRLRRPTESTSATDCISS